MSNTCTFEAIYTPAPPCGGGSIHAIVDGLFYLAALEGEEERTVQYYDPVTEQMYPVTLPNDLNVMQWECTAKPVS